MSWIIRRGGTKKPTCLGMTDALSGVKLRIDVYRVNNLDKLSERRGCEVLLQEHRVPFARGIQQADWRLFLESSSLESVETRSVESQEVRQAHATVEWSGLGIRCVYRHVIEL